MNPASITDCPCERYGHCEVYRALLRGEVNSMEYVQHIKDVVDRRRVRRDGSKGCVRSYLASRRGFWRAYRWWKRRGNPHWPIDTRPISDEMVERARQFAVEQGWISATKGRRDQPFLWWNRPGVTTRDVSVSMIGWLVLLGSLGGLLFRLAKNWT